MTHTSSLISKQLASFTGHFSSEIDSAHPLTNKASLSARRSEGAVYGLISNFIAFSVIFFNEQGIKRHLLKLPLSI